METTAAINLVKAHLQIWSETDSLKRLALAGTVYAENISVIDPGFILNGHKEISDFIGDLLAKNPGFEFQMAKPIETHHEHAILYWQFGPSKKRDAITGTDVFTMANGVITSLLVFVDGITKA